MSSIRDSIPPGSPNQPCCQVGWLSNGLVWLADFLPTAQLVLLLRKDSGSLYILEDGQFFKNSNIFSSMDKIPTVEVKEYQCN